MERPASVLDHPVVWQMLGACAFVIYDASTWELHHFVLWVTFIIAAMELLARIVLAGGKTLGYGEPSLTIVKRGKPLDAFSVKDITFITMNKLFTALFTYHMIRYTWYSPAVIWSLHEVSFGNTIGVLLAFYIFYDLGYSLFHRLLHVRGLYAFVHKHHHRQTAPYRGNLDAINVHPFEFVVGEYNHLATLHFFAFLLGSKSIHVGAIVTFIILGGILASLNHTRFDIKLFGPVYQVRYHDLHHWSPKRNFGQYTMLWDVIMGTFQRYPEPKENVKVNMEDDELKNE
jgi:sterol desaturase/sphingolipid hydroxylase (fatty acid hydroxylase superfamily)